VVTFGVARPRARPPKPGRVGLIGLLTVLHSEPDECRAASIEASSDRLAEAIVRAGALARQRSLVVLVSDFRGPLDWQRPLLELSARHDVIAVEIRDPREQELPNAGVLWLVDPETGRQLRVDTRSCRPRADAHTSELPSR